MNQPPMEILQRIKHGFRRYSRRKYEKEGENDWQEEWKK